MAVIELAAKSDFTPLETNWYVLTLLSYEVRDKDPDQYHKEPYRDVQFQWSVAVPNEEPVERRSWANIPYAYNDKSKFCIIGVALGALIAGDGGEPMRTDLDDWVNKSCRGNVVEITKANGDIGDKIEDYAPLRQRPSAKPAATQPTRPAQRPTRRDNEPPPPLDEDDQPF